MGELRALACWGQAYAYVQRDANLGNPDEHEAEPQTAYEWIQQANKFSRALDSKKVQFPGNYLDCEGWFLFKLGEIDDAIKKLEKAVAISADGEVYLHLALAYERKLLGIKDEKEIQRLIMLVQAHCQHVQELDIDERYKSQLIELQQTITSLESQKLDSQEQQLSAATNNKHSNVTAQSSHTIERE